MKKQKMNAEAYALILALALFNLLFLGAEYLFDNMMALLIDPEQVVVAQGYVLGMSVAGFLIYPFCSSAIKKSFRQMAVFAGTLAEVICIFVILQHASYEINLAAGCLAFVLLGMAGSTVHYRLSRVVETGTLARTVGVAYALGIVFQFLNNNLIKNDMAESIVLAVAAAIFAILILKDTESEYTEHEKRAEKLQEHNSEKSNSPNEFIKNPTLAGGILILTVILITCIFSTLDAAVTLVHSAGKGEVGQWPRLLLAGSALLAGVFYDRKEQRYMNLIMYGVTILSTLCVVVLENGGSFFEGLIVFYLSAGFFVVFFTSSFMKLSYSTRRPKLWAGLGRAVNNICAFATSAVSVMLIQSENQILRDGVVLTLFVLISVAFFIYSVQLKQPEKSEKDEKENKSEIITEKERLQKFAEDFSLTEREREVLQVLLVSDESVLDIAESLLISRAALYRHIASLNEKTDTKSRIGLLQFYYRYDGRKKNEDGKNEDGKYHASDR